jgi:hypothetical protein
MLVAGGVLVTLPLVLAIKDGLAEAAA